MGTLPGINLFFITNGVMKERLQAIIKTACRLLSDGVPEEDIKQLQRLNKADTKQGLDSIKNLSRIGVPYAMLLYERFLGRPFAGHRDSVSEIIGDSLESAIEDVLSQSAISFRKTKRAERIKGFDQTPDFIIPYEVIACIGGRGFGVRREDMKKMIIATRGKVFTAKTLNHKNH